jgi:hypothetical protein
LFFALHFFDVCPVNSDNITDAANLGAIFNSLGVENTVDIFISFLCFCSFGRVGLINNLEGLNVPIAFFL